MTPAARLHVAPALDTLALLESSGERADLVFFSPPYAQKNARYGKAAADAFPGDQRYWALTLYHLMRKAAFAGRGYVMCVADSPRVDGEYLPAVERLTAWIDDDPMLVLKTPFIWNKNGAPGSVYYPSHHYEQVVACHRRGVVPFYDWTALSTPAKYTSGPGRQRRDDGVRPEPAAAGPQKGSPSRPKDVVAFPVEMEPPTFTRVTVGGGNMGRPGPTGTVCMEDDKLATSGEAPFPWKLADWFVRGFSPPGGLVCDPFAGTGTTALAAVMNGRNFVGGDLRASQVDIARRRLELAGFTPEVCDEQRDRAGPAEGG